MAHQDTFLNNDAWLHGNISSVIAMLERDDYLFLKMLSDEQVVALLMRLNQDREELLAFIGFLGAFQTWYESYKTAKDERFDRFIAIAPILRRDAMVLVE